MGTKIVIMAKGITGGRECQLIIAPEVIGLDVTYQVDIDNLMIEMDGTPNKGRLGANAILGVSLAVARAAANYMEIPLYQYIGVLMPGKLFP